MSISAFQDKIFKSGCGVIVLGISAAAMAFGLYYTSCSRGGGPEERQPEQNGSIAIKVGDHGITTVELEQQAQAQLGQNPSAAGAPSMEAFALVQAMNGAVRQVANVAVAKQLGVDLSETAVKDFISGEIDKQIADARQRYIDQKKMKPTATAKEFGDLYKKETGQTPEDYRKSVFENVAKSLADPRTKEQLIAGVSAQITQNKLKQKYTLSDADLKASYDTFICKRIYVSTKSKKPGEAETILKKAQGEIGAGGSFEQAMDRYSNDQPPGLNKKVSQASVHLKRDDLMKNESMKAIASLKPGQVSGIVDVSDGKAIYKLISIRNEAPADFAKNTAKYKEQYATEKATLEFQQKLDEVANSDLVQYPLPGYKALNDFYKTMFNPMGGGADDSSKTRAIADQAKAATADTNPADDHAATLAWYSAVESLWNRSKGDAKQQEALKQERIDTMQALLQQTESFQIRMQLVDMGIEFKDAEMAAQNLLEAARLNNSFDVTGEQQFREIGSHIARMKAAKLLTNDQAALIEKEQERWRTEKAANDKAEKEFKAQQEAEKKKQAVELKKFDEDQKKQAAQTKKEMEANKAKPK